MQKYWHITQIFGAMLATFGRGTRNYQRENTLVPQKIWH